jgi:hypothetical protein
VSIQLRMPRRRHSTHRWSRGRACAESPSSWRACAAC